MTYSDDGVAVFERLKRLSLNMRERSNRIRVAAEAEGRTAAIELLAKELGIDPLERGNYVYFGDTKIEFSESGEYIGMSIGEGAAVVSTNCGGPSDSGD